MVDLLDPRIYPIVTCGFVIILIVFLILLILILELNSNRKNKIFLESIGGDAHLRKHYEYHPKCSECLRIHNQPHDPETCKSCSIAKQIRWKLDTEFIRSVGGAEKLTKHCYYNSSCDECRKIHDLPHDSLTCRICNHDVVKRIRTKVDAIEAAETCSICGGKNGKHYTGRGFSLAGTGERSESPRDNR